MSLTTVTVEYNVSHSAVTVEHLARLPAVIVGYTSSLSAVYVEYMVSVPVLSVKKTSKILDCVSSMECFIHIYKYALLNKFSLCSTY